MTTDTLQPVASLARSRRLFATGILLAATATAALAALALLATVDVLVPFPKSLRVFLAAAGTLTLAVYAAGVGS